METEIKKLQARFKKEKEEIADHSAYLLGAMNAKRLRYEGLKGCMDYRKAVQIIKDGGYAISPDYKAHWKIKEKWYEKHFPGKLLITYEGKDLSTAAMEIIQSHK